MFFGAALFSCGSKDQQKDSNEVAAEANDDKFQTNKAEADADFVADAVASNIAEIEMAQIGVSRSTDSEVKDIGRMLETEHNKLLKDLQSFAGKKSISVPTEDTDADRRKVEKLNNAESKDFNKDWCDTMLKCHEDAISKFETQLQKTADPDLKLFINENLPHLRSHLDKIKACHEKLASAK
jgi:putative membrane protein